jgi:hypothetical protein
MVLLAIHQVHHLKVAVLVQLAPPQQATLLEQQTEVVVVVEVAVAVLLLVKQAVRV